MGSITIINKTNAPINSTTVFEVYTGTAFADGLEAREQREYGMINSRLLYGGDKETSWTCKNMGDNVADQLLSPLQGADCQNVRPRAGGLRHHRFGGKRSAAAMSSGACSSAKRHTGRTNSTLGGRRSAAG